MRIGGAWVGLGLGDSSTEIRSIKAFMRKKFSYCKTLSDTSLFDQQMFDAVYRMQAAYHAQGRLHKPDGIIDVATKIACGYMPPPAQVDKRPMLFTVCGTGVPWWVGPDADTARAVENVYKWQPIGYPAQAVPMGPSIQTAKDELAVQMGRHRDQITKYGFALAGYSQGALAISEAWEFDIKPDGARLNWSKPFLRKAVTWGNPMREKGKVWADPGAGPAPLNHQGVTPTLMVDTPPWWRNYAHIQDLYTDVPDDESGENRTAVWQIIRNGDMISGPDSLLRQLLELGGFIPDASTVAETTGLFKAMIDALTFFGKQTGPHVNYRIEPAVEFLRAA